MAMISNKLTSFCKTHLVFHENNIVLQNGELPDNNVMKKCLEMNVASDWFSEPENDYTAIKIEDDSPVPAGCEEIPLRDYFWQKREDKEAVRLSSRAKGLLHFRSDKRFCPKCGGQLVDDTSLTARKCVKCQKLIFPQIEPAIIVLVNRGNEVLLAKSLGRAHSFYACIAGFVEIGETIETTVKREILEETGITVKNVRYVGSQSWPYPDQLMLAFRAEYESGEIKIQETEISDAKWFDWNNLPEVPPPGSVAHNLISGQFEK